MLERGRVFLSSMSACLLAACAMAPDFEAPPENIETTVREIASAEPLSGIYHWDAPNGPLLADEAARWLGREQQVALAYTAQGTWQDITGPSWQLPAWSRWVHARPGRRLVYSVALLPGPSNGSGPDGTLGTSDDVSLQKCSEGAYDAAWGTLANNLVAHRLGNSILRLGWEFNGDWYAWRASGREAQFASCFRRVVTTMRAAQAAAGFQFDWNPTEDIVWWSAAQINASWPGDAYVDYIGVDAYDASWAADSYPYPSNCDSACRLARQTNAWNDLSRGLLLMRDMAVARGKRLSIPEWGVWGRHDGHGGVDDPFYISKMHEFMRAPENRVAYQIYFDVNWEDGSHQLSDVSGGGRDTSASHTYRTPFPEAAARYKALFSTPQGSTSTGGTGTSLNNPGFELLGAPWSLYGAAAIVTAGQLSGASALRLGGAEGGAEQDLAGRLEPARSYRLSGYARVFVPQETAFLGIKFYGGNGSRLAEYQVPVTALQYTEIALDFAVPAGTARALAYAYKPRGAGSFAWFDNVTVRRVP